MKLFIFACMFLSILAEAKKIEPFHEVARFKLGGDGGWDLLTVDDAGDRLYVSRSNRVMVIDTHAGALIGEVPDVDGAHAIALVPKLNLGFATAGKAGSVIVFDLKSLAVVSKITVGEKPDAIMYDPFSRKVFVFNGKSKNISVVDPKEQKVVATIQLPGAPELAVSDGAGKVFVNLEDKSSTVAIDARKMKVLHTYPLEPCEEPTGLAMDARAHHLFAACGNHMVAMIDSRSGKVLKTLPAGDHVDGAEFDSKRKLAFVSAGEGSLGIFQENGSKFESVQDLPTQIGAKTLALDKKSGNVFLPVAEYGPAPAPVAGEKHARPPMIPG